MSKYERFHTGNRLIDRTCELILEKLRGAPVAIQTVVSLEMGASLSDAVRTASNNIGYPIKPLRAVARHAYATALAEARAERNPPPAGPAHYEVEEIGTVVSTKLTHDGASTNSEFVTDEDIARFDRWIEETQAKFMRWQRMNNVIDCGDGRYLRPRYVDEVAEAKDHEDFSPLDEDIPFGDEPEDWDEDEPTTHPLNAWSPALRRRLDELL